MQRKPLLTLLLALLLVLPATGGHAQTPEPIRLDVSLADVRPGVDWYGHWARGIRTGYLRTEASIIEEGGAKIVRFTSEDQEKVIAGGKRDVDRTTLVVDFEAAPPFRLMRATSTIQRDGTVKSATIALGKAGYDGETRDGDNVQQRRLEGFDFQLADYIGADVWLRRGPETGQSITVRDLEVWNLVVSSTRLTTVGRKSRRFENSDIAVIETTSVNTNTRAAWLTESDADARVVRMSDGKTYERRLESEAEAKSTSYPDELQPTRLEVSLEDVTLGVHWYGTHYKGTRTGWLRQEAAIVVQDGKTRLRFTSDGEGKVNLTGVIALHVTRDLYEFEATAPFKLLRASRSVTQDGITHTDSIVLGPAGYEAETRTDVYVKRRTLEALDYTLADHVGQPVWLRRGASPGQSIALRNLDVAAAETYVVTTWLKDAKSRRIEGTDVGALELLAYNQQGGSEVRSEADRGGRVLAWIWDDGIETRLESEAAARSTSFPRDFQETYSIKLERDFAPLDKLRSVTFNATGPELLYWIKSSAHQRVEVNLDGSLRITLRKGIAPNPRADAREIADALAETSVYPVNNWRLKALARLATGGATTDHERMLGILKFVTTYFKYSAARTGESRVLVLLDQGRADCDGYAKVFVTLARAAGLPARDVTGLQYSMLDGKPALQLHAWVEVVIDGEWVEIDPQVASAAAPALTHLRYGADFEGSGAAGAIGAAGGFRIDGLQLEHDP